VFRHRPPPPPPYTLHRLKGNYFNSFRIPRPPPSSAGIFGKATAHAGSSRTEFSQGAWRTRRKKAVSFSRSSPATASGNVVPLCEDGIKIYTSFFWGWSVTWRLTREPDQLTCVPAMGWTLPLHPCGKMPVHMTAAETRHVVGGIDLTDLTKLIREGLSRGTDTAPPYHALVVRHFCETLQSFLGKKKIPNKKNTQKTKGGEVHRGGKK
jgi:hypothetical protein